MALLVCFCLLLGIAEFSNAAPLINKMGLGNVIPDQYIILTRNGSSASELVRTFGDRIGIGRVLRRFTGENNAVNGFVAKLSKGLLLEILTNPNVIYAEPDGIVNASCNAVQNSALYHLSRLSSARPTPNGGSFTYNGISGTNVDIYVVDTGIRITHSEFNGRALFGTSTVPNESGDDLNGHGTCVAGIAAGLVYGVAKKSTLIAVKVLGANGSGSYSGIIDGLNWVANKAVSRNRRAVINMSLGGGYSQALNDAVQTLYSRNIPVIVAAGNDNADASNYSPASAPNAFTVAASDNRDYKASFSNWGKPIDIGAPGVNVYCASNTGNTAFSYLSGTSMASPVVAGVAAQVQAVNQPSTAEGVYSVIKNNARKNAISGFPFLQSVSQVSIGCTV